MLRSPVGGAAGAQDGAAMPGKAPPPAHGVDQSCLAHLVGYQMARADIPFKRTFSKHIGEPLGLRPVEFTILVLVAHNPGATDLAQLLLDNIEIV